jgi:hypothetical protein
LHAGYSDGLPTDGGLSAIGQTNYSLPALPQTWVRVGYDDVNGTHGLAKHGAILITDNSTGITYIVEGGPTGEPKWGGLNRMIPGLDNLVAKLIVQWDPGATPLENIQFVAAIRTPTSDTLQTVRNYNQNRKTGSGLDI